MARVSYKALYQEAEHKLVLVAERLRNAQSQLNLMERALCAYGDEQTKEMLKLGDGTTPIVVPQHRLIAYRVFCFAQARIVSEDLHLRDYLTQDVYFKNRPVMTHA
jgi:hypothetical protein